ncbi:MAG: DUF5996 family protein [Acidobacteriota bacterium]|nr:DUF5996 family protein [Acidobacteriota bacterium]
MNVSESKNIQKTAGQFPSLVLAEWEATKDTLHLWTQIVGKIRLVQTPLINHFWNVTFYVTARGLTTSAMPYEKGLFEIEFDFIEHKLVIKTTEGTVKIIRLEPKSVKRFYEDVMNALRSVGITPEIRNMPDEIPNAIPLTEDETHQSYDAEYANCFWRSLVLVDKIFTEFRAKFIGKASPVHFFWGSFDLAVTRFNGELAPPRENADAVTREAYSHAVISHGFWLGGNGKEAAFYAYAAPEPEGFKTAAVKPEEAFYSKEMNEFFLMYEDVRSADNPKQALVDFLNSTYNAAADLAKWNRSELERN